MAAEEQPRFQEPTGEEQVGRKLFKRLPTAYEKFMAEQDIAIFHGIGIYDLGTRPWEAGKGHLVKRQDYIPGGLVSAAPGGGDWYHQHFAVAREPLRVLNFWGGPIPLNRYEDKDAGVEIKDGTNAIEFKDEDPNVAAEYRAAIEREGVPFQMIENMYR